MLCWLSLRGLQAERIGFGAHFIHEAGNFGGEPLDGVLVAPELTQQQRRREAQEPAKPAPVSNVKQMKRRQA